VKDSILRLQNSMATKSDVIICGSGSAGLCAAVWLARLGIDFRVLEKRDGPLKVGQADGVQCRTVEVFESFNLRDELVKDAYWVNEVCFWSAQDDKEAVNGNVEHITRISRTADVQPGLSWQPHVILNQARLNMLLIEDIKKHSIQDIEYGVGVKAVDVESAAADDPATYPVTVTAERNGETLTYQAKYVLVNQATCDICPIF
jgi:phenol 2-monooxygenase (NADPH)